MSVESPIKFETLNTSYVSLAALIRYLREREFVGRLHVALGEYEADAFLCGSEAPSAAEKDHATGREAQGEAALQRLLVRSREPGGLITIFEGVAHSRGSDAEGPGSEIGEAELSSRPDLSGLMAATSELIAAIERAVKSTGTEFEEKFRIARIELGDDYPFLDPTLGGFDYTSSGVDLRTFPSGNTYVQALTECLRRVVDGVAEQTEARGFRERVAVELVTTARREPGVFGEFTSGLDRIAGTTVI